MSARLSSLIVVVLAVACHMNADFAMAEEFVFGFAGNGLTATAKKPTADITVGEFTMHLAAAGPTGAWLFESNGSPGMGIGHTQGSVPLGGEHEDFELVGSVGEAIVFTFDRPGILTGLDFDGVKDENYEYMLLQTATSPDIYFFDSFAGSIADPGLIDVPGEVVFLNEIVFPDDGILDLAIPFSAGQQVSITYGQLSVGLPGNGTRLQRIIVAAVPEPATCAILLAGVLSFGLVRWPK